MDLGQCKLCRQFRPLCNSHAIPDSAFKYLFRNSDGKGIVSVDDLKTPLQYSSDSWDVPLLCLECESDLNKKYDSYGISLFRGHTGSSERLTHGVRFTPIDRRRLRMFFLSVLWRMAVSPHESYGNIELPARYEDALHNALTSDQPPRSSTFNVGVYRLTDSTLNGFTMEHLRSLIVAPFGRGHKGFISVCFLFFGFLVEVFLPGLPPRHRGQMSVLSGQSSIFLATYLQVDAVSEIMQMFVRTLKKHKEGLSIVD